MPKRKGEHLWGVESLSDVEVVVEGKTFPLNKFCLSLNVCPGRGGTCGWRK